MKYRRTRQLTVALENRPGMLTRTAGILAAARINVRALSCLDTLEHSSLRLVLDRPDDARALLQAAGYFVVEADVIELELRDTPGVLEKLAHTLSGVGVNVDYCYGSEGRDYFNFFLKVSDLAKAEAMLVTLSEQA